MSSDVWAIGDAYEAYIGRWSRPVAAEFVTWLAMPVGSRWLDVGCGTGALTGAILERAGPEHVTAIDPSAGFVEHVRAAAAGAPATFIVADAQDLPFDDGSFDAAVAGLVLNFVPDPERAVAELARATRAGGTIAVYVWDYAEGMELIRRFWDAAIELDPAAAALDEASRFPICHPEPLERLFREAGLADVSVGPIEVPTVFRDFDDLWAPFLGGQGPAPGYATALDTAQLDALRERLRAMLPIADDGSIALSARAWAARGLRP
jgi:SAM-dependent methyltransferase